MTSRWEPMPPQRSTTGAANILFTEPVALRLADPLGRAKDTGAASAVLSLCAGQNPQSTRARLARAGVALAGVGGVGAAIDYAHARARHCSSPPRTGRF